MTSPTNLRSEQIKSEFAFERQVQDAAQEAPAPKPAPASVYRGALYATLPSVFLWTLIVGILGYGAWRFFGEFMALGSNFLR